MLGVLNTIGVSGSQAFSLSKTRECVFLHVCVHLPLYLHLFLYQSILYWKTWVHIETPLLTQHQRVYSTFLFLHICSSLLWQVPIFNVFTYLDEFLLYVSSLPSSLSFSTSQMPFSPCSVSITQLAEPMFHHPQKQLFCWALPNGLWTKLFKKEGTSIFDWAPDIAHAKLQK